MKVQIAIVAVAAVVGAGSATAVRAKRAPRFDDVPGIVEARTVVASIVAHPGYDRQNCGSVPSVSDGFSPYGFARGELWVTPENFQRCRARRAAVIAAVRERLAADVEGAVREAAAEHSHLFLMRSYAFSEDLAILIDLNAVEALPELVDVLAATEGRDHELPRIQVLGTITAILRNEGYRPILESDLERAFKAVVVKYAERDFMKDAVKDGTIVEGRRYRLTLDRHHRVPRPAWSEVMVPLTSTAVAQVSDWARDFLATTPEEHRLGERGMDPWPILR